MKSNKPIHSIRFGHVQASIWENETKMGIRHNVTVSRSYLDDEKNWQRTDSFGRDDLLLLAKAVDLAHTWINAQTKEEAN